MGPPPGSPPQCGMHPQVKGLTDRGPDAQTDANYLHIYSAHVWNDTVLPGSHTAAGSIHKVDIYLRASIRMEGPARATSITGDSRMVLIGFEDGSLATITVAGKVSSHGS